ncbi:MAG TPA: hypothetical protein VIA62_27130 [Thermoanaerobaculia bacterium]|jgi:hypothetical protein|nr:hypothetical protein [Thermoanaerobaculia bacterium]
MLTTDQMMSRAEALARQAAGAGVHDDQLSLVLVHLKRHRDIAATLALLVELKRSSFAYRSRSTLEQLKALEESVRPALQGVSAWEDAAGIVGWARRLVTYYQPLRFRSRPPEGGRYPRT